MGQCVATNKAGNRCGGRAISGATVCRLHGGLAPQVLAKARARLLLAAEDAVSVLHANVRGVAWKPGKRKVIAVDVALQLRAAGMILDRVGMGPGAKIEVAPLQGEGERRKVDLSRLSIEELEVLSKIAAKLEGEEEPLLLSTQVIDIKPETATWKPPDTSQT